MSFKTLDAFTKKVADMADQPSGSPAEIKAGFDAAAEELREYFNNLVNALKSTASDDSGAKNTGATSISGLTGTNVQSLLENLKTIVDGKVNAGTNYRMENCNALFFTNGGSNTATATVTFGQAFTSPPTVMPADMYQSQSYGDVILYPYIYNVTTTGFSVKIAASDGAKLGTVGTPANIGMHFVAFGN
jgi:hypothetical protein